MKRIAKAVLTSCGAILLGFAPRTNAQVQNCFDCVLGLYDDVGRTSIFGTSTPLTPKDIYLGIDYPAGMGELTGIELSVAGMRGDTDGIIITDIQGTVPPTVVLGSLPAPADTSATSMGMGGQNYAWNECLPGSRTLLRIQFIHFAPLVNKVFQVKRKYPTSNPIWRTPIIVKCDTPIFTVVRVTGGCYILNWNGDPEALDCIDGPVAVEQRAWSSVKSLFR